MPKQKLFVFGLILLVVFLILPLNSFAIELDEINLRDLGKYLSLPENKVQDLIWSLIGVFHSEWVDQMASSDSTAEERAVPSIMKKVAQVQALNHMLTDAPFQVTVGIVNNAVKIARLIGAQDVSTIISELEKESVKKATEYGMSFLLENEIRTAPGAINFEYISKKGDKKTALLQYIMVYKPSGGNKGEVLIRFYSPNYLEPPESRGTTGGVMGQYNELTTDMPPFIVDIRGAVENFMWVNNPSVAIGFPAEVPDLGIKPLGFWEKNILKPIVARIKDVEVIITKVVGEEPVKVAGNLTGKLSGIVGNVWDAIKTRILQQVKLPGGAGIGETVIEIVPRTEQEKAEIIQRVGLGAASEEGVEQMVGQEVGQEVGLDEGIGSPEPPSLAELQRQVDEAARLVAALSLQVEELVEARAQESQEEVEEQELEDEQELDEQKQKEKLAQGQIAVCPVEVNSASAEDLDEITGVGPVIAQRIIEARPFYSLNELETKVKGIGPVTLQEIIDQGCAYVSAPSGGSSLASSAQEEQEEEQQQQEEESQPAKNLLANEFFEDWTNNATPTNWIWENTLTRIGQDNTDPLRGSYNVWLEPIASHNTLEQTVDATPNTTYYGEIWAKGTDKARIRVGIIGPGSSYGDYTALENSEWTKVSHSRTIGDVASATIAISVLESEDHQRPRIYVGAAWLSTSTPPSSWPQGEPPNKVEDFTLDFQNSYSNRAALTWATSTDPDTLSENLYYKIYYSKAGELTEGNLDDASTQTATTTQTSLTLNNLDFNSTYYFGIKAYDPENNFSSLATTTSYKTATLAVIAGGFPSNISPSDNANNGRKIVRTSSGDLYTVYSRAGSSHKVYLANSTDGGFTWSETEITSEEDQKNPSIAIDSKNNLHIVWQGIVDAGTSTKYQIRYTKYNGSSFSVVEDFTPDEEQDQMIPVIGIDLQDKIHLAWVGKTGSGDRIYYRTGSDGSWGDVEVVKEREPGFEIKSFIEHFTFAIDGQNNLHFTWFESVPSGWGSSVRYFRYLKGSSGNWGDYTNLKTVDLQNYSSIAIDSGNNAHIIWDEPDNRAEGWFSVIQYLKCSGVCDPEAIDQRNEEKVSNTTAFPSAAIDSDDNVYVVWKRGDIKPLSQMEYKNGAWQNVKTLTDAFDHGAFTNMLWSINNQPATGYAFVFYEGTNLKFYGSEDLTW